MTGGSAGFLDLHFWVRPRVGDESWVEDEVLDEDNWWPVGWNGGRLQEGGFMRGLCLAGITSEDLGRGLRGGSMLLVRVAGPEAD